VVLGSDPIPETCYPERFLYFYVKKKNIYYRHRKDSRLYLMQSKLSNSYLS
jgi:hypothetical protein